MVASLAIPTRAYLDPGVPGDVNDLTAKVNEVAGLQSISQVSIPTRSAGSGARDLFRTDMNSLRAKIDEVATSLSVATTGLSDWTAGYDITGEHTRMNALVTKMNEIVSAYNATVALQRPAATVNATTSSVAAAGGIRAFINGLTAGSVVHFAAGTYGTDDTRYDLDGTSGTAANLIQMYAAPGATVIFRGFYVIWASYLKFGDISFRGPNPSQDGVIWLNGCSNVTIDRCEVRDGTGKFGIFASSANNCTVNGCWIYNNGHWSDPAFVRSGGTAANLDHGIYWTSGSSNTITNNVFEHNLAWGLQLYQAPNGMNVANNLFIANGSTPTIYKGGGIIIADAASNCRVYNNIMMNSPQGNAVDTSGNTGTGNVFTNNLSYNNGGGDFETASGLTYVGSITGQNPLVNYTLDTGKGVYTLSAGSPAIDAGVATSGSYSAPTLDRAGVTRTGLPDLGAYEKV